MPRYHFHVVHGTGARDADGVELPSVHVAQDEAIRLAGEVLRDLGAQFWNGPEWRLEVADAGGRVLFVLSVSGEERSPAPDAA